MNMLIFFLAEAIASELFLSNPSGSTNSAPSNVVVENTLESDTHSLLGIPKRWPTDHPSFGRYPFRHDLSWNYETSDDAAVGVADESETLYLVTHKLHSDSDSVVNTTEEPQLPKQDMPEVYPQSLSSLLDGVLPKETFENVKGGILTSLGIDTADETSDDSISSADPKDLLSKILNGVKVNEDIAPVVEKIESALDSGLQVSPDIQSAINIVKSRIGDIDISSLFKSIKSDADTLMNGMSSNEDDLDGFVLPSLRFTEDGVPLIQPYITEIAKGLYSSGVDEQVYTGIIMDLLREEMDALRTRTNDFTYAGGDSTETISGQGKIFKDRVQKSSTASQMRPNMLQIVGNSSEVIGVVQLYNRPIYPGEVIPSYPADINYASNPLYPGNAI